MSDALAAFGVEAGSLVSHNTGPKYPKPVYGRVAHIDADFLSYQVSAESKDELAGNKPRKSFEDMQHNARTAAEHIMRLAGATSYVCHTTPKGSTKGGRDDQAVQQEYQAARKDRKNKPELLDEVRAFIGRELNGRPHLDQEADDGMAQAAIGEPDAAVICSKDKDLRSVPGLHLDMYTGELIRVDPNDFGTIAYDGKKLTGWGPKFFFAQCLMGDAADSVKGAPAIPGRIVAECFPTKAYIKAIQGDNDAKIDAELAKTSLCGPAKTFKLLEPVTNAKDAFHLVRRVFVDLHKDHGYEFKHWKTGAVVTPTQALLGDMLLLWMRRNKNPKDVVEWLKSL